MREVTIVGSIVPLTDSAGVEGVGVGEKGANVVVVKTDVDIGQFIMAIQTQTKTDMIERINNCSGKIKELNKTIGLWIRQYLTMSNGGKNQY